MTKGLPRSLKSASPIVSQIRKVHFSFNEQVDITGVAATADRGGFVIGDFPEGNILFLGGVAYATVDGGSDSDIINNWNGDYSVGSVPNTDADLNDVSDQDIVGRVDLDAGAANKLTPRTRSTSSSSLSPRIFDNTDGSLEINFNLLIDDNVISDGAVGSFTVTGDIWISYVVLGDD